MSSPQNPLNVFRSYSYHHILIACDGTESAEALAYETELTIFDHERAGQRFAPQSNSKGNYVTLINGMSDASLTIESVKWSSVIFPTNTSGGESYTGFRTMSVDGEMVIQEPFGVNFFNILNETLKSLKVDANGLIFVLKTIFVGHRHDNQSEYITNIRPLMFMMYDINASLDVTGATYNMSFVGVSNGAAKLPQTSSVGDGFNFQIKKPKIKDALEDLAVELNEYYVRQQEKFATDATCNGLDWKFEDYFRKVTYEIVVDEVYANYDVGNDELISKATKGENDVVIGSGDTTSIESLIDAIVMSSQQVINESKDDDDKKRKRYIHRITSTLNTNPEEYKVIYHVQRQEAAVIPADQMMSYQLPDRNQGITFDYIFTGKNVDIKDFDLKMNMGLTFFQTLAAETSAPSSIKSYKDQSSGVKVHGTGTLTTDDKSISDFAPDNASRIKRPFFLGMSLKNSGIRNRRSAGAASSYTSLLMRHAAYENIEAKMVIHGNPQLLEETCPLPSDLDPVKVPNAQVIVPADTLAGSELRNVWPALHKFPGYVKVNVKMPSSFINDPNSENPYPSDYAVPFWYQGWYNLLSITHDFNGGEFTQELEMYSLPTDAGQSELGKNTCEGETTEETTAATQPQPAPPVDNNVDKNSVDDLKKRQRNSRSHNRSRGR